jgi:HEAT repeat protein
MLINRGSCESPRDGGRERLSSHRLAAGDPDPGVRRAAVGSLGLGSEPVEAIVDALLSGLRDNAWQVREEAAATR